MNGSQSSERATAASGPQRPVNLEATPDSSQSPVADGAWGARFPSLGPSRVLSPAPVDWPPVAVEVEVDADADPPTASEWTSDFARYTLLGGHHVQIQREPLHVKLGLRSPTAAECIVQPHLSSAAATISVWLGREALHGGAFEYAGGAWVLLGSKGHGKSSTLALLARSGIPIITDDLVVCNDGELLAGARCVDLRAEPARKLGVGRALGLVGTRERFRIDLSPCRSKSPLRGWVFLDWGSSVRIDPIRPAELFGRLIEHRTLPLRWVNPDAMLELASRPAFTWCRPQNVTQIDAGIGSLLDVLDSVSGDPR